MTDERFAEVSLGDFARRLSERSSAPTAGSALAVTLALAAALVEMVAQYLPNTVVDGAEIVDRARGISSRGFELAGQDAARVEHFLQLRRERSPAAADALGAAAQTMSELASLAVEVAEVARFLVDSAARDVRGDAASALQLALAVGEGALQLAEIDALGMVSDSTRRRLIKTREGLARSSPTASGDTP